MRVMPAGPEKDDVAAKVAGHHTFIQQTAAGRVRMYMKKLYARWADMDFRQRIGPVVMKDELEYFKEVGLQ
jgi:hypothetical protein